jgi:hypothetical protein
MNPAPAPIPGVVINKGWRRRQRRRNQRRLHQTTTTAPARQPDVASICRRHRNV